MQRFLPVTLERPKVLLPLVNVPMLDYTLEWLAASEVEEVITWSLWSAVKCRDVSMQLVNVPMLGDMFGVAGRQRGGGGALA